MSVRYFLLLVGFWGLSQVLAQPTIKFEREYRLPAAEVPQPAQAFVAACLPEASVRWYGEQSQDGTSIEAKAKHERVRYSIEFDPLGQVEDVEILTSFPALPTAVQDSICASLTEQYARFRMTRIQRQWTAPETTTLQTLIREGNSDAPYRERYEIVLKARTGQGVEWFEYLFSKTGEILRRQQIVFRNTDNLDY